MCDLCQHYPCATNCPNHEEKPICYCDICGEGIYNGDMYYNIKVEGINPQYICKDCIEDCKTYAEWDEPDPDDYKEEE